nr:hypothetical protein [Methylobacterium sp. L1A1]
MPRLSTSPVPLSRDVSKALAFVFTAMAAGCTALAYGMLSL